MRAANKPSDLNREPAATSASRPKQSAPSAEAPSAQPTPKPTPPMDKQWTCVLHGLGDDGKTSTELPQAITVGTKLLATCEGPSAASLSTANLKIELNDQQIYSLHLLKTLELKESSASLVVVPWRAGDLKLTNPALVSDHARVGMGDLQLTVASVVDPKTNPKGEPFPPWRGGR